MTKPLTALERLLDSATVESNAAYRHEMKALDNPTRFQIESYGRHKGKHAAYSDAYFLVKAELSRLQVLFQNGALTAEDFGL